MPKRPAPSKIKNAIETKARPQKAVHSSLIEAIENETQIMEDPQPMAESNFDCDVLVIGAGPGGYVAAIRAAQLGGKVICVEKEFLGGTCLNWGCIPSKALIASAETYQHVLHSAEFGVVIDGAVTYDFNKIMARKQKVVETLRGGVGSLFKKNGVKHIFGTASFKDPYTVSVEGAEGKQEFKPRRVIIATGSAASKLPIEGLDYSYNVWTSDDAVVAKFVPKSMIVVGGGAVGLEFAYVFNSLGCKVTVVELADRVLPLFDEELSIELQKSLTRGGIKIITGVKIRNAARAEGGHSCTLETAKCDVTIDGEVVLLGVGRHAVLEGLNLEAIGVELHKRGIVVKNDRMQTSVPHIFAIGDCTGNIQLAHVASMEGTVAAANAMDQDKIMDYRSVPNCVYTVPEVASVGLTEKQARELGYDVKVGKFQFRPLGRSMATGVKEGIIKVVSETKYDELLGMHLMGPHVTDLIHEGVAAIKLEATVDYMIDTIHAHPTFAEGLLEAYEDVHGLAIHKMS